MPRRGSPRDTEPSSPAAASRAPVERIRDHYRAGMTWRQPRPFVPEFELRRGATFFATLEFHGGAKLRADARAYDREWHLEQLGFLRRHVDMVDRRTQRSALTIRLPLLRDAQLVTPTGRSYTGRAGWTAYTVKDATGETVVRLPYKMRLVALEADVEITERAAELPELPELVVAGWFLAILSSPHAASAAVGTSAGIKRPS